jgi:alpha-ketoglutaric semialdehyde dehydrogenase
MSHEGSYINGKWVKPASSKTIRNVNPAKLDEVITEFPAATKDDTLRAIEAAEAAFPIWSKIPAPERGRYLARAAAIARGRVEEIGRTITREEGKILAEGKGEAVKGINVLEFCSGEGFRVEGKTLPSEVANTMTYTIRRPIGVAGVITPWNFPWAIPCWKIAPALVSGCTVVFKPASLTPLTASILMEILEEAGLPAGVCNMCVGSGADVGDTIVTHPATKVLTFTGSNSVGGRLYEQGAKKLAKVTCEMGGKNPLVVMADADLEKAAKAIVAGAFGSTGQRCTATSRLIVHKNVKKPLLDILIESATKMKLGDGLDPATQMGPAVDKGQFETDLEYIEIAKNEGAKLLVGGGKDESAGNGYFVRPTLFDGVKPEMRLFQEEVFGPVLAVSEFDTFEQAMSLANGVAFGLTSSIFTESVTHAQRFIHEIHSGMTHVNEPTIGGEAQLPFGGVGATGVGEREMAQEGVNFFTELKTVFINYAPTGERSMIR